MKIAQFLALVGLVALGATAQAQPRRQFDLGDTISISPGRAYVFYRTDSRGSLLLLREPREDERPALEAARIAAFEQAHADYRRRVAQWESDAPACQRRSGADCPERPIEPALNSFPAPPPARDRFAQIVFQPRFTAGDEGNSYFRELEPGTYILYGNVIMGYGWNGLGVCLCMGSLRFEARPGQVTDLGNITFRRMTGANHVGWSLTVTPPEPAMRVPARLAGLPRVGAEFHAADKVPNYFSVEIDRHPPLPGILAYERDQVIDVRTRDLAATSAIR